MEGPGKMSDAELQKRFRDIPAEGLAARVSPEEIARREEERLAKLEARFGNISDPEGKAVRIPPSPANQISAERLAKLEARFGNISDPEGKAVRIPPEETIH